MAFSGESVGRTAGRGVVAARGRRGGRSGGWTRLGVMRWIDHWVGLPLCFVLALLTAPVRLVRGGRRREVTGRGTIVVLKFFGLGSIVQASPLLRAIRRRYPAGKVVFVTFEANRALVVGLGVCDEVRVIRTGCAAAFAADVVGLVLWCWRRRVEAVLDLEFFSKFSTLLAFTSGAPIRVGFHLNDFWRYRLITHPVYFNYYRHIGDVFRQMGEGLGVRIEDEALSRLGPSAAARASAEAFLKQHGWSSGEALLGVNVNAGEMSLERRWPVDQFLEVCRVLLERRAGLWIVLTGSAPERPYVASLAERLPGDLRKRVMVAAGRWGLEEFAAALGWMSGFLTNDSGPMHLAAAAGVPMVSLWGPGRPDFYAPRSPAHRTVYADYPCSPCLYMFTAFEGMWCGGEGWCMDAIRTDEVIAAVEAMLSGGGVRS